MTKTTAHVKTAQRKKGFTLTEIAIVLGIIGLILGAVWTAASGVYASTNSTKYSELMATYIAAVRSYCANNSCTGGGSALPTLATSPATLTGASIDAAGATIGSIGFVVPYDIDTTTQSGQKTCIAMASGAQAMGGIADSSTAALAADGQIADTDTTANGCASPGATPTKCQTVPGNNVTPVPNSCTAAGTNAKGFCYSSPIPGTTCTAGNGKGGTTNSLSVAFALSY